MDEVSYQVEFAPAAERQFRDLPRKIQERVAPKIAALAANPRPRRVEKLEGESDLYRVRVGQYRVIYQIHDEVLLILVVRVAHRREVYRNL